MSKDISACLSSNSIHWSTPSKLYQAFIDHGYVDPCPLNANFDGLKVQHYKEKLFINPPFNALNKWVNYAIDQFKNGCDVVLLMPSRTDTRYFAKIAAFNPIIYFIEGRLHFNDCDKAAPFPTIFIILEHGLFSIPLYRCCTLEGFIKRYVE